MPPRPLPRKRFSSVWIYPLLYQPEALAQAKFLLKSPPSFLQSPSGQGRGELDSECSHLPGPELFSPSGKHPHTRGVTKLASRPGSTVGKRAHTAHTTHPWALGTGSLLFWNHHVLRRQCSGSSGTWSEWSTFSM